MPWIHQIPRQALAHCNVQGKLAKHTQLCAMHDPSVLGINVGTGSHQTICLCISWWYNANCVPKTLLEMYSTAGCLSSAGHLVHLSQAASMAGKLVHLATRCIASAGHLVHIFSVPRGSGHLVHREFRVPSKAGLVVSSITTVSIQRATCWDLVSQRPLQSPRWRTARDRRSGLTRHHTRKTNASPRRAATTARMERVQDNPRETAGQIGFRYARVCGLKSSNSHGIAGQKSERPRKRRVRLEREQERLYRRE